jgi:hypothetical protein
MRENETRDDIKGKARARENNVNEKGGLKRFKDDRDRKKDQMDKDVAKIVTRRRENGACLVFGCRGVIGRRYWTIEVR